MKDRIGVFRRAAPVLDQYGQAQAAWTSIGTFWAHVSEMTGREREEAGTLEASGMAIIKLRASTLTKTITEADRVVARGRTWNIRSAIEVGNNNDTIEILAERGVAA